MPKLGRPDYRSQREFMHNPDALSDRAPFGTFYSNPLKVKIVGGKYVPLYEETFNRRLPREKHPLSSSRKKVDDAVEHPSDLNLHLAELPHQLDNLHKPPVDMMQTTRMPDRQFHRGRFFYLSPSDGQISGRFGGVPLSMERQDLLYSEQHPLHKNGHLHHYHHPIHSGHSVNLNPHPIVPPILTNPASPTPPPSHDVQILEQICSLLPQDTYLPNEPLQLTSEQENTVVKELAQHVKHLDSSKLKDIYLDLTHHDSKLIGYVAYQDLHHVLSRNYTHIAPSLLRILEAIYVSRIERNKVNYEKILSLLGAALRISQEDGKEQLLPRPPQLPQRTEIFRKYTTPRSNEGTPRTRAPSRQAPIYYYQEAVAQQDDHEKRKGFYERDDAKLFRELESQIQKTENFQPINFESLRMSFQRADSLHRGSLSADQMKAICYDHGFPVSENLLDKIIERCHYRNGGQYDWQEFVSFLERVTPLQTGLHIPSSKKPTDYQRHVLEPATSWPHAESAFVHSNPSSNTTWRHLQPTNADSLQLLSEKMQFDYENEAHTNSFIPSQSAQVRLTSSPAPPPAPPHVTPPLLLHPPPLYNYTKEHQENLSRRSEQPPPPMPYQYTGNEPWFNRFMKLADALYRNDIHSRGFLPRELVAQLIVEYNTTYGLGLTDIVIENTLSACTGTNVNRVDINSVLKRLATQSPPR